MKAFTRIKLLFCAATSLLISFSSSAAIITVTTTNNVSPGLGQTSLLQALTAVQAGDTIRFLIPGIGPHYIETPVGGYPLITQNNVTIDGYSQLGATPNTNPILAANNAAIKIVLDSRNGNSRVLDFPGDTPNDDTGYGATESAILGVLSATNVTVRGLSLLAVPLTGPAQDVALYGISFAKGANGHVSGCWIGVDVNGKSGVFIAPADGITGFRYRGRDQNNVTTNTILMNGVVIGVARNSASPRSEFNVIAGVPAIPIILEGQNIRISGNFLGVLPDGLHDFNVGLEPLLAGFFEGFVEIGRAGNNVVIGVDGDGVNDADERNIIGGTVPPSLGGYDHSLEFYGQTPGTNIIVAGNYFGIGVDGITRFTNGVPPLNAAGGQAQYRFGSDLNGVSDAVEGNVVYNNWPPEIFGPNSPDMQSDFFDELSDTGSVSLRGNTLVNNFTPPVNPLKSLGAHLINYYSRVLADLSNGVMPILSRDTTTTRIRGQVPLPNTNYPVVMVDVYLPDPEGITNGMAANIPELTNGFVQGKIYLGSFTVDGPSDLNPTAGLFEFDTTTWALTNGTALTVTANYIPTNAPGTRTITSLFSDPVTIGALPILRITATREGSNLRLTWTGGTAPYQVQRRITFSGGSWANEGGPLTTNTALVPITGTQGYFRVASQ